MDAHCVLPRDPNRVSFADLSQELRDMVYSYLWQDTPYIQPCFGIIEPRNTFKVCYGDGQVRDLEDDTHLGLPRWLRTSRGVCFEGVKKLLDNSHWFYRLYAGGDLDDIASQLVNPSLATRITFEMCMSVDSAKTEQGWEACINTENRPDERRLSTIMSHFTPRLKHLTLSFQYFGRLNIGEYDPATTFTVDLSPFDKIGLDLDSFTLSGIMPTRKDPRMVLPSLRKAFDAEISRLGALLVGQHTCNYVEAGDRTSTLVRGREHEFFIKIKVAKV